MNKFLVIAIISLVAYSVLWLAIYRFGSSKTPTHTKLLQTPIETTTSEQRARGKSSFTIAEGRHYGITRSGFFMLVFLGYVAIVVAWAIAFFIHFRSPAM